MKIINKLFLVLFIGVFGSEVLFANYAFYRQVTSTCKSYHVEVSSSEMLFSTDDNFHKKAKLIKEQEMKKITHFKTPSPVLGVFELPVEKKYWQNHSQLLLMGLKILVIWGL